MIAGYNAILANPFDPHVVARTRPSAYQWYVVMKYLDNLIAWGDSLFLADTQETSTRPCFATCSRPISSGRGRSRCRSRAHQRR